MNQIFAGDMVFDFAQQARFNDLPKWAKDERLYNCETSVRRRLRKKNQRKKAVVG